MRFMMMVRATERSEAGELPSEELLTAMTRYNGELVRAGVLLAAEGLHPSARGARVSFAGGWPAVVDGPFAEPGELIAGFWLVQVKSKEEAIEWAKRCPNPMPGSTGVIELRQVLSPEDLGPALAAAEERMRGEIASQP